MRPLRHLEQTAGVEVHVVPCEAHGALDPDELAVALRQPTRLVVVTHASNVTGALAPLGDIAAVTHAHGATLLVDAAQTAGAYPIDVTEQGIDLLAFTGHKSLFGPQGTGGLVIAGAIPEPLTFGGTGSNSEEEHQPRLMPDRLESGTLNGVGVAGLAAGVEHVTGIGVEVIRRRGMKRLARLLEGLLASPGVRVYGPADPDCQCGVVSVRLERRSASEVGMLLDDRYGVLCRVGLHCSPAAHRTIGTFPSGTVRLSLSDMTTDDDIDRGHPGRARAGRLLMGRDKPTTPLLEAVLTFAGTMQALRAEKRIKGEAIECRLVPTPRELSSTCALSLTFSRDERDAVSTVVHRHELRIEAAYIYPADGEAPEPWEP